jgi:hypothetical protein
MDEKKEDDAPSTQPSGRRKERTVRHSRALWHVLEIKFREVKGWMAMIDYVL